MTAVEWFADELKKFGKHIPKIWYEEAIEMEKDQQMKTYEVAIMRGMSYDEDIYHKNKWRDPEKYYSETFKQQEQRKTVVEFLESVEVDKFARDCIKHTYNSYGENITSETQKLDTIYGFKQGFQKAIELLKNKNSEREETN